MKERIRILMIDHTAQLGGGELALLSLVEKLDRTCFEPLVLLCETGPLEERLKPLAETHVLELAPTVQGIRKDSIGWQTLLNPVKMMISIRYAYRLVRKIHSLRPDIIHTNSLKADVLGGLAAKISGTPLIWHIRDRIEDSYLPAPVVKVFRRLCRMLPDTLITNSFSTLETLQIEDARPTVAIPSGFNVTQFAQAGKQHASLGQALEDGSPILIGMVGRITPWKGQDVFLRAAAEIHRQYPQTRFAVVGAALFGEEEYERTLHKLVEDLGLGDAVEFQGFQHNIASVIGSFHMLVHASVTPEPLGQVIAQGMAAGKPVVATAGGGALEMIREGETGLLATPGDVDSMAAAILRYLHDPGFAQTVAESGQKFAMRQFSADSIARRVEEVYERMLPAARLPRPRQRVRTLHYNTTASVSGAEIVLLDVLRGLDPEHFDRVVVCPDGKLSKMCEAEGVRVATLNELQARFTSSPFTVLHYFKSIFSTAIRMRKTVRNEAPDIIHANSIRAGIVSTIATIGIDVPIMWHLHDMLPRHPISSLVRLVAASTRRNSFVAVSAATLKVFCGGIFGDRLRRAGTVILNGIDTRAYSPASPEMRQELRAGLDLQPEQFCIAHIGQVSQRKDQMGMLQAFQRIALAHPEAILLFVGTPVFESGKAYAEQVKAAATEIEKTGRVRFLGFRRDIPKIMDACDLLVINSLADPCPLTVLEGMASATPILGSDVDGIPELLAEGVTGWLTQPKNPAMLADRIEQIAALPEASRRQVANNARMDAVEHRSIQRYRQNFVESLLLRIEQFNGAEHLPQREIVSTEA